MNLYEIKEKSPIFRDPKNSFEISLKISKYSKSFKEPINNINFEFNNKIIKYLYSTYLSTFQIIKYHPIEIIF